MPDDITRRNDQDLVAVNWNRGHPWHQLGHQLSSDMTIEEGLELVGVAKEHIELVPLFERNHFESGLPRYDEIPVEAYGVKSSVFGIMSVAGNKFTPTPRRRLLEKAYDITGLERGGAHLDTIGILGERGETFFAYIQVPELVIDPGGVADKIERGLFLATAYDGSLANVIGYSNIRVVCRNTLNMAMGRAKQTIRAKHTRNAEQRISEAALALQYSGAVEQEVVRQAEAMLRIDGVKALTTVMDHFWDVGEEGLGDKAKAQRYRKRAAVMNLYEGEDNLSARLLGENGWAAYQAFVEFQDHERDVSGVGSNSGKQALARARTAVLPGQVVDSKVKASELILALGA